MKKLAAIILAAVMMLTVLPLSVFAEEDVTLIKTQADLLAINEKDGTFVLDNDITLTSAWTPITLNENAVIDGNGHTIYNVMADYDDYNHVGFISESFGTIKNLTIEGGEVNGNGFVGALDGINYGTIENCHAIGVVATTRVEVGAVVEGEPTHAFCGGLVGYNSGIMDLCSTVEADVAGYDICGGLVGANDENGIITRSWTNDAHVNWILVENDLAEDCIEHAAYACLEGYYVYSSNGGLVGMNNGIIENCYANDALIFGFEYNGGLVGYNTDTGVIRTSYVGDIHILYMDVEKVYIDGDEYVLRAEYVHPCVGKNENVLDNVYFKLHMENLPYNYENLTDNGIAIVPDKMFFEDSFAGFDFNNVWMIDTNKNSGYPIIGKEETVTYTVTFVDYDGRVLSEQRVAEGEAAIAPEAPTREGYDFIGWDKEFNAVYEDMTVTAQYNGPFHTVTFVDYDGTVIDEQRVLDGEAATAPEAPTREGYVFVGWDKEFDNVISDLTVTAVYEEETTEPETHTVKFLDKDGNVIAEVEVVEGEAAQAPEAPEVEGYHFVGWDKDITNVTEDMEVRAMYEINVYTVTFVDFDGTVIATEEVEYGAAATDPENQVKFREYYVFLGWDKEFNEVKENMTVNARYGLLGDVDMDGIVDTADATLILRQLAELQELSADQQKVADVDRNGKIETLDVQKILEYVAKLSEQPKSL